MEEKCSTIDCITMTAEERPVERNIMTGAGQEARPATEQFNRLLESLPDAMVVVSQSGKIAGLNAHLEHLFGYAREELLGKNLEVLMPERFRARHRNNVADFISHPRARPMGTGLELFGLKKDGTEFPVDISLSYVEIEGGMRAMAAVRDITERKSQEHKIELNYQIQKAISSVLKISLEPVPLEEQLALVLDLILTMPSFAPHARGSIYLVDEQAGTLVLKAMHGFSVAQVVSCQTVPLGEGSSLGASSTCQTISSDCLDRHHEIQYALAGSYGQYCVPIVFGERSLGLINLAVAGGHQRVPEEEEFLSAIAKSLAGLIERHHSETEKAQLREQLVESERLAALGRITANVSHTIRNPLMAIGGFANRLLDKLPEGTKEKKYAGLIHAEAVRLENVMQNVLLFTRRDAGQREKSDLSEIIDRALLMYEDICKERAIIINRQLKDSPAIDANKAQILQAIENLLSNAVDAMPGGGSLMVLAERETVGEASFVKVTVKDTGQGIEEEDKVRIFEPFFTTNLLLKGTGLGLSITKKVIEDHGGFIHVESRVGEGSTFCLYFPLGPGR